MMAHAEDRATMRYSIGQDVYDNRPAPKSAIDFDAFEREILGDRSRAKGTLYFTGPLTYGPHDDTSKYPGDDFYRLATHALPRRFLAVDHDGFRDPQTFEEIYTDLSMFRGFGYTTWSHLDTAPRARAVFELSREVTRPEGIALGRALDRLIEKYHGTDATKSDKSVHQNEQPVYSPGPDARIFHFPGKPINVDDLLHLFPEPSIDFVADIEPHAEGQTPVGYARLTEASLIKVLSLIDCFPEPIWHSVSNSLARAYGESAREFFTRFSKGEFWGTAYPGFDPIEVNEKYNRSLRELATRPRGFGVRHLIRLSGLRYEQLEFESDTASNVPAISIQLLRPTSIAFPALGPRGKPLQVTENLEALLTSHAITVRYNQIAKSCELLVPGLSCVLDETSNTTLTLVTDHALKAGMTAQRIPEMVDALASQRAYCPVQAYILSKPWDGVSRLGKFNGQIVCSNPSFAHLLLRKWLIQAVGAVFEQNGIANAGVIVLTGPQGAGKTMLFKDLASEIPGVFLEGQTLDPASKDSVMTAVSRWIVELGELEATFRKADLAQLKAFITRSEDKLRRPFARRDSTFPRRTVFAGTVNEFECLHDPTGNRRFWPIAVKSIVRDTTIDYQQLWAEVKTFYDAGERWYLDSSELTQLSQYSGAFLTQDPEVEKLLSHYGFVGCTNWTASKMTDICAAIGVEKPSKAQMMRLAAAIRNHNGGQTPRVSSGVKYHFVPAYALPKVQSGFGVTSTATSAVAPVVPVAPVS
jgi:putative DNA primase/helicase